MVPGISHVANLFCVEMRSVRNLFREKLGRWWKVPWIHVEIQSGMFSMEKVKIENTWFVMMRVNLILIL